MVVVEAGHRRESKPRSRLRPVPTSSTSSTSVDGANADLDQLRRTAGSSPATATGCSARASRPRTPCRRRWCGPGRASTASRAARRCGRGSTASPPTCASTCCGARSAGPGRWTSGRRRRPTRCCRAGLPESTLGPAGRPTPGCCPTTATRPSWPRRGETDPPRLRRRAAAPAARAAGGADPARGAALAGHRGGRAARHERRVGQQRAAAGPGRRSATLDLDATAPTPVDAEQQALLARYVDAFERYDITSLVALLHEDATFIDAALSTSGCEGPVEIGRVVPRARASGARAPGWSPPSANGCAGVRQLQARGPAAAASRSPSRSSRSQTAGSSGSTTSSTPSCSPPSACPPASSG